MFLGMCLSMVSGELEVETQVYQDQEGAVPMDRLYLEAKLQEYNMPGALKSVRNLVEDSPVPKTTAAANSVSDSGLEWSTTTIVIVVTVVFAVVLLVVCCMCVYCQYAGSDPKLIPVHIPQRRNCDTPSAYYPRNNTPPAYIPRNDTPPNYYPQAGGYSTDQGNFHYRGAVPAQYVGPQPSAPEAFYQYDEPRYYARAC